ncbi:hypothetical protein [Actinoallomurus liliacearum]|uniref:hypothetical protein n=1 Tax=Actinoallomurus liliacearum TaxID=1080073 RepID=UPI0031EC4CB0
MLAEAESLAQAARVAYRPPPEVTDSSDASGTVTVTMNDHGRRVTRVVVAADWRDRVGAEGLGPAVMEAVVSARLSAMKDFAAATAEAPSTPSTPSAPASPPSAAKRPMTARNWDELGRMLDTLERAIDACAISPPIDQEKNDETVGHSANRRIAVSMVAGQPSSVNMDHRWALRAGHRQLSASLLEAFDSAYAAGAADDAGAEPTADLFGELQSIVNAVFGEGRHA